MTYTPAINATIVFAAKIIYLFECIQRLIGKSTQNWLFWFKALPPKQKNQSKCKTTHVNIYITIIFFVGQTIGILYFYSRIRLIRGLPPNRVLERCQQCYWPRATTVIALLPGRPAKRSNDARQEGNTNERVLMTKKRLSYAPKNGWKK